jgi:hypothetical protein
VSSTTRASLADRKAAGGRGDEIVFQVRRHIARPALEAERGKYPALAIDRRKVIGKF